RPHPRLRSFPTRRSSDLRRVSGRNNAFVALSAAILTAAGVALAAPVSVLTVSDGASEFVGTLDRDESLQYSYRQSIYQVTVLERSEEHTSELQSLRHLVC